MISAIGRRDACNFCFYTQDERNTANFRFINLISSAISKFIIGKKRFPSDLVWTCDVWPICDLATTVLDSAISLRVQAAAWIFVCQTTFLDLPFSISPVPTILHPEDLQSFRWSWGLWRDSDSYSDGGI